MKIAITGTTGFVGSSLLTQLDDTQYQIIYLVRNPTKQNSNYIQCDLTNKEQVTNATKNVDCLIHCAYDYINYSSNILITENLLHALKTNKIKRFIHISTLSVYDYEFQGNLNETSPANTYADVYATTKLTIENLILNSSLDTKVIVLQPPILFGWNSFWTNHAISFCKTKKVFLPACGDYFCNYLYIDDLITVIKLSIDVNLGKENKLKLLISGSEPCSWYEFYQLHADLLESLAYKNCLSIATDKSKYTRGNSFIIHYLSKLRESTLVASLLSKLKKLRRTRRENKQLFKLDCNDSIIRLKGSSKLVHSSHFKIDTEKAKQHLGFTSQFNLANSLERMKSYFDKDKQ